MTFETDLDGLIAAAAAAAGVTPGRPVQPIIGGIRIDAGDGGLRLTGTDYEVTVRVRVPAAVTEPGTVVVPGRFFAKMASSLPAGRPVLAELDGDQVRITCGRVKFTVPTMPADLYPTMAGMPPVVGTVAAGAFRDALPTLLASLSTEAELPKLQCVYFEIDGGTLTMVATDRYRIPVSVVDLARETDTEIPPFMAHRATLDALLKSSAGGDDKITIGVEAGADGKAVRIGFSDGRREITGRVSGEEYVKWRSFIKPTDTAAIVPADELAAAVKRIELANEERGTAPVTVTFRDGLLVVSASRGDGAAGEECLEAVRYTCEDGAAWRFKTPYLLDGLTGAHAGYVRLSLSGPLKPVIITAAALDDDLDADLAGPAYQYVLMPMR